jgi:N-methylhydantoinase A
LRLVGVARLSGIRLPDLPLTDAAPVPHEQRAVHLDPQSGFRTVPIYDGNRMRPGQKVDGPALIEERNTTILIGAGDRLEIDASDNFLIHVAAAGGAAR